MMTAVVVVVVTRDWSGRDDDLLHITSVGAVVLLWSDQEAHFDLFEETILDNVRGISQGEVGKRRSGKRICAWR